MQHTVAVTEMGMERRGPAELVMAAAVARRHYLAGRSKIEIADELGISRFKVARLLDFARERGMVRIEIVAEGAIVVDRTGLDFHTLSEHLGEATSRLLSEILVEGDVLGLPWARSIDLMTQ